MTTSAISPTPAARRTRRAHRAALLCTPALLAAALAPLSASGAFASGSWTPTTPAPKPAPTPKPTPKPAPAPTSHVLQKVLLGWSVEHRPIYAYELGDVHAPTVLVLGEMHGNEPAGVRTANAMLASSHRVTGLNLWIIPTINPDGLAHDTRYNAHSVDLNRNFPWGWVRAAHTGSKPLSEPESRILAAFISAHRPSELVSIHQPLDGVDADGVKNPTLAKRLIAALGLPARPFTCGTGCHGTMTEWVNHTTAGAGITVEFPATPSVTFVTVRARDGIITAMGGRLI